jgi:ketosteroid isomerase-like protein
MKTSLPPSIDSYFQAANSHDTAGVIAAFSHDAIVTDEGHDYRGPAIKEWSDKVNEAYRPHAEVTDVAAAPDAVLVTAQVSGTFPGSPVQLRYRFTLKDDKIAALLIEA